MRLIRHLRNIDGERKTMSEETRLDIGYFIFMWIVIVGILIFNFGW